MNTPRPTKPNVAPAYFLGRPAAFWQFHLRRHRPELVDDEVEAALVRSRSRRRPDR